MPLRLGRVAACAMLLALAACNRSPPIAPPGPMADASAAPADGSQPIVLAGGPPASSSPAESPVPVVDQPEAAATEPASAPLIQPDPTLAGAAAADPDASGARDPLEPLNRRLYTVDVSLRQVVKAAPRLAAVKEPHARAVAHAARNLLDNLDEPGIAANDVLQRRFGQAARTVIRFVINSTVGLAGVADVAGRMGIKRRENSADRTLASYGAPAGPYFYLPIVGPTTLRAIVGAAAEGYLYPPRWLRLAAGIGAALRGAGYAKMAQKATIQPQAAPSPDGRDGYIKARRAYFEARTLDAPPPGRSGDVASMGEQRN